MLVAHICAITTITRSQQRHSNNIVLLVNLSFQIKINLRPYYNSLQWLQLMTYFLINSEAAHNLKHMTGLCGSKKVKQVFKTHTYTAG